MSTAGGSIIKPDTPTSCSDVNRSVFAYRLDLLSSEEVSDAGAPGVSGSVELRGTRCGAADIDRVGDGKGCSVVASLLCYVRKSGPRYTAKENDVPS